MIKRAFGAISVLILISCAFVITPVFAQDIAITDHKIVAYLAAWENWSTQDIPAKKLTHINLSFARIEDGKIANVKIDGKGIEAIHFQELKKAKLENPDLKVLIAVGGWGGDGFSDAALTPESRNIFAKSVADYLSEHDLDGIDIDWEFPVQGGWGAIKARPEDKQNFTLFLQAIRAELDNLSTITKKDYLLTYAANVNQWAIDNIEMDKVIPLVDHINLMTYDYHGGWEAQTGHHTALYANKLDTLGIGGAADAALRYISAGVPSSKIVLGTAFYGRLWEQVEPKNNGLYQKASTKNARDVSYKEIVSAYTKQTGFTRYWDETAKAAYLFNPKTKVFITYDDPQALEYKVKFVRDHNLGGVMLWELSKDKNGTLIDILYKNIKQ